MAKLEVSLAVNDYDRTRALFDGRATIEGCEVRIVLLEPEEAFHRAFRFQEFDITEMSLSSHTVTTARGASPYVGIPAFVSRVFRHSGIYIRTDRGIDRPADLKGKTIGVPEYQQTANVWARGILHDEYGVKPGDIKWRRAGLEEPGRQERAPIELPPEVELRQAPGDRSLSQMLEQGEIDGVMTPRAPSCVLRGAPHVGRLFPDYVPVEQAYFRKTRIFPIMHLIGIRRPLVERHPWLAVSVFKAFLEAKARIAEQHRDVGALTTILPWGPAEYERMRQLLGEDYWAYHAAPNRHVLETFARYAQEQGLTPRRVAVEEMFAPSTLDLSKI